METITIEGESVRITTPEGQTVTTTVAALSGALSPSGMDTGGLVLPDGVKSVRSAGPITILVHETPPRVYRFKWIAEESPLQFGKGTQYRDVTLALPYLIVIAVFASARRQPVLTDANECFFRNAPLETLDDGLHYPALLNCSRFEPAEGHPLAWICTQYMRRPAPGAEKDANRCLRAGLRTLMHCLLETGFNYSSEVHEGSSWFTQSKGIDPRLATVERWEEESRARPLFPLEVPWIPTGMTVRQVTDRIFANVRNSKREARTAGDLARAILNRRSRGRPEGLARGLSS